MPTSLADGKQPLRLAKAVRLVARRACARCASKEKCRQALRQGIVTLGEVGPSYPQPPTLWLRREVVVEAHEFSRRICQFQPPAFPPRCGKSITVGIDPSSRMQDQFQGAWR